MRRNDDTLWSTRVHEYTDEQIKQQVWYSIREDRRISNLCLCQTFDSHTQEWKYAHQFKPARDNRWYIWNSCAYRLLALTALPIPDKYSNIPKPQLHVHHKDGNSLHDILSNLEILSQEDHGKIHMGTDEMRSKRSMEFQKLRNSQEFQNKLNEIYRDPSRAEERSLRCKEVWENIPEWRKEEIRENKRGSKNPMFSHQHTEENKQYLHDELTGRKFITNGTINYMIHPSDICNYPGFWFGRVRVNN